MEWLYSLTIGRDAQRQGQLIREAQRQQHENELCEREIRALEEIANAVRAR